MVALSRQQLTSPPVIGAAVAGLAAAAAALTLPGGWLEAGVEGSGVVALLPEAEPPLGATARMLLALGGGLAVAAIAWAALYLLFGPGGAFARAGVTTDGAAVRAPLSAAELGVPSPPPVLEIAEDRALPVDLDTPLAAFDPAAIPAAPREPVRPVAPLAPGERLQTFALAPPPPKAPSSEPPSIEALLRRLEQGAERRTARAAR